MAVYFYTVGLVPDSRAPGSAWSYTVLDACWRPAFAHLLIPGRPPQARPGTLFHSLQHRTLLLGLEPRPHPEQVHGRRPVALTTAVASPQLGDRALKIDRVACGSEPTGCRAQVCKVMPDAGPRVTVERLTPSSSLYVWPSEKVWEADGCGLTTTMPAV